MIDLNWIPFGLLLPMLIGAAAVWLLVRGRDNPTSPQPTASPPVLPPVSPPVSPPALPVIGWSLGIGLGATVGMLSLLGLPPWKPMEAHHWVLIAILPAAMVVGLVNAIPKLPQIVHWLLRLCVVVGTVYVLMQSQLTRWTTNEKCLWLGGIGAVMLAVWAVLQLYAQRSDKLSGAGGASGGTSGGGRLIVFVLGATAGAIGGTTIASGSITGGQLTASLAAAIGGGWLATLGRNARPLSARSAVDIMFPPSFGLLVYGWYYAWQMQHAASPHIVAGMLAVAPLGLWVTSIPWVNSRPTHQRTAIGLALTSLLILAALSLAGYEAALRNQAAGPSYY